MQNPVELQRKDLSDIIKQALPGMLMVFIIPIICIIVVSGNYAWWEAWMVIIITGLITVGTRLALIIKRPGLARERVNYQKKQDIQPWDKVLMPMVAVYFPILIWLVAGFDKRYDGSPQLGWQIEISAMLLMILAYLFSTWAMLVNQFFAAIVRIQSERGQQVIQNGPYRIVRHPGYAGGLLGFLLFPLTLSALWAYIPIILYTIAIVLRTVKEDRFLQMTLPGYQDYAGKTRYRLFPGIW